MKFSEFYKLITENDDDDLEWFDQIAEQEYYDVDELKELISRYNLSHSFMIRNNKNFLKVHDQNHDVVMVRDGNDDTYTYVENLPDYVEQLSNDEIEGLIGYGVDSVYNGAVETTLKEMEEHPGTVYHYTTDEGWEEIQEAGFLRTGRGSGMNNRHVFGVFTSISPETYADGSYGDICLAIDLTQMMKDLNLPKLSLSFEPEIEDYMMQDAICSMLGIDNRFEHGSDVSQETVIVHHQIPVKFITVMD